MQLNLALEGKEQQELFDVPEAEPGQVNAIKKALWLSSSAWGPAQATAGVLVENRFMGKQFAEAHLNYASICSAVRYVELIRTVFQAALPS